MNASKAKGGEPDERLEGAVEWLLEKIQVNKDNKARSCPVVVAKEKIRPEEERTRFCACVPLVVNTRSILANRKASASSILSVDAGPGMTDLRMGGPRTSKAIQPGFYGRHARAD